MLVNAVKLFIGFLIVYGLFYGLWTMADKNEKRMKAECASIVGSTWNDRNGCTYTNHQDDMKYRIEFERQKEIYILIEVNGEFHSETQPLKLKVVGFDKSLDRVMGTLAGFLQRAPRIDDFIPQQQKWMEIPERFFK